VEEFTHVRERPASGAHSNQPGRPGLCTFVNGHASK